MIVAIEEGDRQLILLALAVLSLASPGFDGALNTIAMRIDNIDAGRAKTYDEFRRLRRDTIAPDAEETRALIQDALLKHAPEIRDGRYGGLVADLTILISVARPA